MDVMTHEAPLDNSFQKDRRELVSKGSLGRRRKPSRSNLRLILSPSDDRQDIDVFHGRQNSDSDGSFGQLTTSHHAILDNQQTPSIDRFENSAERANYSEVVASIHQICTLKAVDFNGNNRQSDIKSNNRRNTVSPVGIANSKLIATPEHNKYNSQPSVAKILQSEKHRPKSNGHPDIRSNGYREANGSKSLRIAESANSHQVLKNSNQQKTVTSKNHINVITFSNHRQIITSSPVQPKKPVLNGKHFSSESYKESSLPRTSKEPNLVAEAQQFSIDAKLRRKKSEVQGRSAVLIQTWERRTQSESHSRLQRDSKSAPKNRFGGKENATAMPDSYICIKYKGSLQNGDKLHNGELVPSVRDVSPDENMLYRVPDERPKRVQHPPAPTNCGVTVNGNAPVQEPEWISLSRKLCAKFVEGHIEPHSPDSYPYEEPEGVGEVPTPSPQPKTHSGVTTKTQPAVQKKKLVPAAFSDETPSDREPPWIHLSRKLCNKFIEEHIEYPPITNGHFVEVPDLVEPNGDVRIIENVGKPKSHKSKQKKESEPEWVSLSKKLRAKFIESHIDDPDTIALDNQLNASDPEETSSETLSDVSQELPVPRDRNIHQEPVECKNFTVRSKVIIDHTSEFQENESHQPTLDDTTLFPNKECSWEYQEMEFDQESNSGNFQDPEYCDEPLQEARVQRGSLPEDDQDQFAQRMSFPYGGNTRSFKIPECYNNDVKFLPYSENDESGTEVQQHNKLITVQFIARSGCDARNGRETAKDVPDYDNSTKKDSFFNLATWEEARCKEGGDQQPNCQESALNKKLLSKSLDNLCDSLEERTLTREENLDQREVDNSRLFEQDSDHILVNSNDSVQRKSNGLFLKEFRPNPENPSDASLMKEGPDCLFEDMVSESDRGVMYSNGFVHSENKESIYRNTQNVESSSEDEVFEPDIKTKMQSSKDRDAHYEKIPTRKSPVLEKEKQADKVKVGSQKVKCDHSSKNGKDIKCNGMIPNSIYDRFPDSGSSASKHNHTANKAQNAPKEPVKLGMSKWITISKSEQNISKPEYSNLKSTIQNDSKNIRKSPGPESTFKGKSKRNNNENQVNCENENSSRSFVSSDNTTTKLEENGVPDFNRTEINSNRSNGYAKENDLKAKCKSMCDISFNSDSPSNVNSFKHHESVADLCSGRHTPSQIEFQHFEYESEIPLCAKLVSNHNKRMISKNAPSSDRRAESPSPSESSHVYEDMFKETPSGPSDSEASSWIMKNNTYYINGRSSSMNDLDFSDSCSMSVKCDYASSSENSMLQSRHSSYASSSFYVNLRDYDSHMLEPSLNKGKKTNGKLTSAESTPNISKSNPPTPESLRHLFTSPLSSIHSPPNRAPRLLNRMPSDPQSHYYSTAAATSSAFKHGFASSPPKPKKTERSSSIKIKDIAHGIILTFKKFQNHSKSSSVRSNQQVDVSHLAEMNSNSEMGKSTKAQKNSKKQDYDKGGYYWQENGRIETDSGFLSDVQRAKARRSSSDLTGMKSNSELFNSDKKKSKSSKKNGSKGKKSRSKTSEPRTVPTVSRKVQQMADGTLYLVTTVSGDTALPGVYSDSPDTSSELSSHKPVKVTGESNC